MRLPKGFQDEDNIRKFLTGHRFQDKHDIYKRFLEILQREQKPIQNLYAQVTANRTSPHPLPSQQASRRPCQRRRTAWHPPAAKLEVQVDEIIINEMGEKTSEKTGK